MSTSLSAQEATRRIESSAPIHLYAFEIALGVLTGFALLCFPARIAIRLIYQRQLNLDDAFLIVAATSLAVATGILYHICYWFYLPFAAFLDPEVKLYVTADHSQLLDVQKEVYPYLALIWTTLYAIKGSFLAFIRPLVWHISRGVNWYFWFLVVFCVVSWALVVVEPFILCPYGTDFSKSSQCFDTPQDNTRTYVLTTLVNVLDILSDIMVASIPIIVLRNSLLSRSTKFCVGVFLCLSIFMAFVAIVRLSGLYYRGHQDAVWEFFWLQTEGAVAVMMASLTSFRTPCIKKQRKGRFLSTECAQPSCFRKFVLRFKISAREQPNEKPASAADSFTLKLPQVPSPIFTGIRSFIRNNNRNGESFATSATVSSRGDDYSADYHIAIKAQTPSASGTTH
ncbi:hypothetical protein F5Y14DRAFT_464380 [Nemania sp. NC0429]|nr:hypothetical protein F5Y14DRAFT_464380 [Nemania sp. NC0429]